MNAKARIQEIMDRHMSAAEGPWYVGHTDDGHSMNCTFISTTPQPSGHDFRHIDQQDSDEVVAITLLQYPGLATHDQEEDNSLFVAKSWEDVGWLLARMKRLDAVVDALRRMDLAVNISGDITRQFGEGSALSQSATMKSMEILRELWARLADLKAFDANADPAETREE